ncbi:hypothetical protein U2F10_02905 [Leptothoe sp. EHU-05/26/07-4]
MKSRLFAGAVAIACGLALPSTAVAQIEGPRISGEIIIIDVYYGRLGEPCNPQRSGYQDIMQGFNITVRNGNGNVISVVPVPQGVNDGTYTDAEDDSVESLVTCKVIIPETALPQSDFYVFDLGRRGEIVKSYQQMVEDNWELILSIGGSR